jgi:hypothetical protein
VSTADSVAFYMWQPYREALLTEHRFYAEQAKKRLLSQFDDIEAEAQAATDAHVDKLSRMLDPERHDLSDVYEEAGDKGIELYQLLADMQDATQLSVIAGMYHQWDKKLRDWIRLEVHHWHSGQYVREQIWKADGQTLLDFLEAFDFDIRSLDCYKSLIAMRLVVNVYKHGSGPSFDELKKDFPEYIANPFGDGEDTAWFREPLDYTNLQVSDAHIDQFSEAIVDFWTCLPEKLFLPKQCSLPSPFVNAFKKDGVTI